MNCLTNCHLCKCLNAPCYETEEAILVLGVVADENYTVYVTDNSSNRTEKFTAITEPYGAIGIDMAEKPGFFHSHADYTIWITLPDADMMANENITIDEIDYTCLRVSFERVFSDSLLVFLDVQHLEPDI